MIQEFFNDKDQNRPITLMKQCSMTLQAKAVFTSEDVLQVRTCCYRT